MFAIRHGKDIADSMGSMIVNWLREKESSPEGIQPNLDAIISHLQTCIDEHNKYGTHEADIVLLPWKPLQQRPAEIVQLKMGNMRPSNSKMTKRNADGKIVIIEKGLPDTSQQGSPQIETGKPISLKLRIVKRRARKKAKPKARKKADPVPERLSKDAKWRLKMATTPLVIKEVDWRVNPLNYDIMNPVLLAPNVHEIEVDDGPNEPSSPVSSTSVNPFSQQTIPQGSVLAAKYNPLRNTQQDSNVVFNFTG